MKNKNSIKYLLFFIGNGLEIKAMTVRSNVLLKDTLPCQQKYEEYCNSNIPINTISLRLDVLLIFSVLATIPGPKSPTTTKNAMQVPIRNPMMHSSTTVLPGGPNVWKAMRRERESEKK